MFSFLKNLFITSSIPTTSFFEFYKKMVGWQKSKVFPFPYNLPDAISFPPDFWSDVIKIHKLTLSDGRERAISVFWADGELLVTSVAKGDESSVKTNENVSVRYIPHPVKSGYYRKEVLVNGSVVKKLDIYHRNVPKSVDVKYLFNMHTHPVHVNADGSNYFSFFSLQDVNALIGSEAIMTGLVTDRLWILIRSSDTPTMVNLSSDAEVTEENLKERMKLGVYVAEFNKKAIKQ
ncbi:MAG: hypothetical protein AB9915_02835 [Candidatus Dojkabacteria bacterium]